MNYNKYDKDMTWEEYEKILLKRPGFKEALEETRLEYEIARALIKARLEKGLTPSLAFLKRLAEVLNASLQVQFKLQ